MNYRTFSANDATTLYGNIYRAIKNADEVPSRLGMTREFSAVTNLGNPRACVPFVLGRNPNYFGMLAESLWLLSDLNDVRVISTWNSKLKEFSDDGSSLYGAYGPRLAPHIPIIIDMLDNNWDTRQAVAPIYEPRDVGAFTKDLPCNDMVMFKIRNGMLNLTVMNRSNDLHWGLFGVNIPQFSMLMQYVADATHTHLGFQSHVSDSLHLYMESDPHLVISERMDENSNREGYWDPNRVLAFKDSSWVQEPLHLYHNDLTAEKYTEILVRCSEGGKAAQEILKDIEPEYIALRLFIRCLGVYADYKNKIITDNDASMLSTLLADLRAELSSLGLPVEERVGIEKIGPEWIVGCIVTAARRPSSNTERQSGLVEIRQFFDDLINTWGLTNWKEEDNEYLMNAISDLVLSR